MLQPLDDNHFMKLALQEAQRAFDADEVPVGAVVTCKGQVIARGHNLTERLRDFTAHAEMQAFTSASEFLGGKYLTKCTLYVTLEPCVMCLGAMIHARINRIVFGAYDLKSGACGSCIDLQNEKIFNHKISITGGILEQRCKEILHSFFKSRRT